MHETESQNITLEQVLMSKEQRAQLQAELRDRHDAAVISITINMPGSVKYTDDTVNLLYYALDEIRRRVREKGYSFCEERVLHLPTGPAAVLATRGDAGEIKASGMAVEQATKFGRMLDIDVFDSLGKQVSRSSAAARHCFVCSGSAVECMRKQAHSQQEIQAAVKNLLIEYKAASTEPWPLPVKQIGDAALEAMLMEVACTPSPGLVDRVNSGAHRDMDFFTFIQSSSAINTGLYRCALAGWRHEGAPADLLVLLRRIGSDAERSMMQATGGVNTQKGLIFLLGIVAAATALTWKRQSGDFDNVTVLRTAAKICHGIVEREMVCLKHKHPGRKLTAGERLYLVHGVTGIRGEIESGLTMVSDIGLPLLQKALNAGLSINDALVHTLMGLMTAAEDTTILNRHDPATLSEVQETAGSILTDGGMLTDRGRERILDLDVLYSNHRNISPGGSADLLAVTYFLYKMKQGVEWSGINS